MKDTITIKGQELTREEAIGLREALMRELAELSELLEDA